MNMPPVMNRFNNMTKRKKTTSFVIAVIVIVILIAIFSGGSKDGDKLSRRERKNKGVVEEVIKTEEMTPIVDGDYLYSFTDISWNYAPSTGDESRVAETKVGFFFDNFTRFDGGNAVAFARPFHIGWFAGDCAKKDEVNADYRLSDLGTPIAFTECGSDTDKTNIGLFQDGKVIAIYSWIDEGEVTLEREIDITTIVNSSGQNTNNLTSDTTDNSGVMLNRRRGTSSNQGDAI